MVKLLASNPADKEVLQATAKALKEMATERPALEAVQRSGSRWLRVLGRQGSAFLFERLAIKISPAIVSVLISTLCVTATIVGLVLVILRLKRSNGKVFEKKYE